MKRGFTLVEVVIVIAVISVLAALIVMFMPKIIKSAVERSALSDAKNTQTSYFDSFDGDVEDEFVVTVIKSKMLYLFGYNHEKKSIVYGEYSIEYNESNSIELESLNFINNAMNEGVVTKRPLFADITASIKGVMENARVYTGCCLSTLKVYKDINIGLGDTYYIEADNYNVENKNIASVDSNGKITGNMVGTTLETMERCNLKDAKRLSK